LLFTLQLLKQYNEPILVSSFIVFFVILKTIFFMCYYLLYKIKK